MTANQSLRYQNHDGKTSKYDMISIFSLRPPELLGVFRNPIGYFRYCYIEKKQMKIDEIEESISENLENCLWIDCFSRKVSINILALDEVTKMIENNISEYRDMNIRNDSENFAYKINSVILDMIENYYSQDGINDEETSEFL